jgi:undecaprenyl phosphate N,N'-diacetylbacillosamine 1-phosphate transferase
MYQKYFKRLVDLIISILALPVIMLITIPVAIAIKVEDKGPVFYCSERIGKDFQKFTIYKFRSMKVNAPDLRNDDGSTYNTKVDTRVTKIGKLLRETSIDEFPQFINVIKGDMSIIGPRPGLASNIRTYKEDEKDKVLVKPGITGYTQAYFRNSLDMREKRLKDAWYANNVSFYLDVKIFFKTIITVLKREGIYTNSSKEKSMSE